MVTRDAALNASCRFTFKGGFPTGAEVVVGGGMPERSLGMIKARASVLRSRVLDAYLAPAGLFQID